jgi:hypothetical protein
LFENNLSPAPSLVREGGNVLRGGPSPLSNSSLNSNANHGRGVNKGLKPLLNTSITELEIYQAKELALEGGFAPSKNLPPLLDKRRDLPPKCN